MKQRQARQLLVMKSPEGKPHPAVVHYPLGNRNVNDLAHHIDNSGLDVEGRRSPNALNRILRKVGHLGVVYQQIHFWLQVGADDSRIKSQG